MTVLQQAIKEFNSAQGKYLETEYVVQKLMELLPAEEQQVRDAMKYVIGDVPDKWIETYITNLKAKQ